MAEKLLNKQFKSERADNLEAYMKSQKVGLVLRKVAGSLTVYEELTKDGDTYTLSFTSTFKNAKMVFKMNEEFTDTGVDGRTMKTLFYEKDGKLFCDQNPVKKDDVACRWERELQPDGSLIIISTSLPDEVKSTRYYSLYKQH